MKKFWGVILWVVLSYSAVAQRMMENLDRGLVAVRSATSQVFLSWRILGTEYGKVSFNIYRNGIKINATPLSGVSCYTDNTSANETYTVKAIQNGVEQAASKPAAVWLNPYKQIPLSPPDGGTGPDGVAYTYSPNDASCADLDGDGQYEIILKWDPSNSKDNSQSGNTGNVYIDAYQLDGTRMWRINLGKNIRAGAHYTQFLVYDFDNDGKAEMVCRTADSTVDGKGTVLGDGTKDYRNATGYILSGPEYLTVFRGTDGMMLDSKPYTPARGTVSSWGDSYGNRVDRFLAAVAYLDGVNPSMVFARGYYTRLVRSAWDFKNGQLVQRWIFDSNNTGNGAYAGMGNHQMTVGDVDGDGKDEIVNGASAINDDGTGLYSNGLGHGDAMHMSDMDPDRPGQEFWQCHEEPARYGNYGLEFRDAKTGQPLWGVPGNGNDIGRALAADVDPRYKGYECWGAAGYMYNCKGDSIAPSHPTYNHAVYWDGDLLRELLDGTKLEKWNYLTNSMTRLVTLYLAEQGYGGSNNTTKANPCLTADLFGDWREEIVLRSSDGLFLNIYTTTTPTTYGFYTLMHDAQYRLAVAWQNAGYNQPPHPSFYLGEGMAMPAAPQISLVGAVVTASPEVRMLEKKIAVYPNPTNDHVRVMYDGKFDYALYSENGHLIRLGKGFKSVQVNGMNLPGIYWLKITVNGVTVSKKIIKNL